MCKFFQFFSSEKEKNSVILTSTGESSTKINASWQSSNFASERTFLLILSDIQVI